MKRFLLLSFCFVGLSAWSFAQEAVAANEAVTEASNFLFKVDVETAEVESLLNVDITTTSEQVITIEIYDEYEEVVFRSQNSLYGVLFKEINTAELKKGEYALQVKCNDQILRKSFVKR